MMILLACSNPGMEIKPIDDAFNRQMFTRRGLDKRLFPSDGVFQYYEISKSSQIKADALRTTLLAYIHKHYSRNALKQAKNLTIFFYESGKLKEYKDLLYPSASQNADGNLTGQNKALRARMRLGVIKNDSAHYAQTTWLFSKGKEAVMTSDTLKIQ
ncbi:hypothetical protein FMM05_20085 [Flavobacterium zepuense]|uniref:Uncharacterized protein n=1 Tax=Flavobacterium zepuense TaxID=2593302 RepID=A0A552UTK1_9FLAO|nr:hypothetical protein [Flavobacterium zepuense]TRW21559.1 hypothetical protein FMM05_20085 [Flavobacterium zepuense]